MTTGPLPVAGTGRTGSFPDGVLGVTIIGDEGGVLGVPGIGDGDGSGPFASNAPGRRNDPSTVSASGPSTFAEAAVTRTMNTRMRVTNTRARVTVVPETMR